MHFSYWKYVWNWVDACVYNIYLHYLARICMNTINLTYRTIKVASGVWVCLGAENEFLIVKLFVKPQDKSREWWWHSVKCSALRVCLVRHCKPWSSTCIPEKTMTVQRSTFWLTLLTVLVQRLLLQLRTKTESSVCSITWIHFLCVRLRFEHFILPLHSFAIYMQNDLDIRIWCFGTFWSHDKLMKHECMIYGTMLAPLLSSLMFLSFASGWRMALQTGLPIRRAAPISVLLSKAWHWIRS